MRKMILLYLICMLAGAAYVYLAGKPAAVNRLIADSADGPT